MQRPPNMVHLTDLSLSFLSPCTVLGEHHADRVMQGLGCNASDLGVLQSQGEDEAAAGATNFAAKAASAAYMITGTVCDLLSLIRSTRLVLHFDGSASQMKSNGEKWPTCQQARACSR